MAITPLSDVSPSKLFAPITVGDIQLGHRVVLAPLTRFRADSKYVPLPHVAEYYAQRGSVPGTLLVTEATFIAPRAAGYANVPGIWNEEQIAAWKKVTDAVHARGSFIYLQLWALGRAAVPSQLAKDKLPPNSYVSASSIPLSDRPKSHPAPRPLTIAEIHEYVELYAQAAENAVKKAGFDGVEVHGANGYLVDQFLQDVSNVRTDSYGGSVENRTRFALEVVDAIVKRVGERKTAIRLSPWGDYQDMGMKDPVPTFTHLVTNLKNAHPNLSYIHVVEPRTSDSPQTVNESEFATGGGYNDFIRAIWVTPESNRRLISAGGYKRATAMKTADEKGDLVAFGRPFIANPDLPYRLAHDISLTIGDRSTYYVRGSIDPKGYTDYPFSEEFAASAASGRESKTVTSRL